MALQIDPETPTQKKKKTRVGMINRRLFVPYQENLELEATAALSLGLPFAPALAIC